MRVRPVMSRSFLRAMRPGIVTGILQQVLEVSALPTRSRRAMRANTGSASLKKPCASVSSVVVKRVAAVDGLEVVAPAARPRRGARVSVDRGAPRRVVLGDRVMVTGSAPAVELARSPRSRAPTVDGLVGAAADLDDVGHPLRVVAGVHHVGPKTSSTGRVDGERCARCWVKSSSSSSIVGAHRASSHRAGWHGRRADADAPSSRCSASRSTSSRSRPPNASSVRAAS